MKRRPSCAITEESALTVPATVTRALSVALTAAIALSAIAVLGAFAGMRLDEVRFATVLSGSMEPGINPGSVVIGTPITADEVQRGDAIMFRPPEPFSAPGDAPVVHRVTEVTRTAESGGVTVRTKGDANPMVDPWVMDADATTMFEVRVDSQLLGVVAKVGRIASGPIILGVLVLSAAAWMLRLIWCAPSSEPRPQQAPL